ncbi:MAG: protein-disulfide reductase DsbD domain-containing protein [Pseudomonadota bacterium]
MIRKCVFTKALALTGFLIWSASAATAGSLDDVIQIEVIDGGVTQRGTHLAGLRLTMAPGWKTYWRSPGDAGIPPHFNWRGSRNIGAVAITWPAPKAFEQEGMRSIGYTDTVILPLELTPKRASDQIRLKGAVDLGVCKDVCIPERLTFDLPLSQDAPRSAAIAAALAARPYTASEAGVSSVICSIAPIGDGVQVTAQVTMPSAGGQEVAIIEPGNPQIWASDPETWRDGGTLFAVGELIHSGGGAFAVNRSELRFTVLGDSYAVDIRGCHPG